MTNPRQALVDVAQKWVGVLETSKNHFPGMQGIWSATNYPDGWSDRQPYCAAFMCYVVREALAREHRLSVPALPRSPSVGEWRNWARNTKAGVMIFWPDTVDPMPGDIVSFLPNLSHIGLVESYDGTRKVVNTIEANTDDKGTREGDGIMRRERALSYCGEFYRLPCRAELA